MNNADRAKRAFDLISSSEPYGKYELPVALSELLRDLVHVGEMNGIDMGSILDEADEVLEIYNGTEDVEFEDDDSDFDEEDEEGEDLDEEDEDDDWDSIDEEDEDLEDEDELEDDLDDEAESFTDDDEDE
jgi:hypothetical protein